MKTEANISDGDAFYEALLNAHQGLSDDQSEAFNARLILLLANQIGDAKVLADCLAAARESDATLTRAQPLARRGRHLASTGAKKKTR